MEPRVPIAVGGQSRRLSPAPHGYFLQRLRIFFANLSKMLQWDLWFCNFFYIGFNVAVSCPRKISLSLSWALLEMDLSNSIMLLKMMLAITLLGYCHQKSNRTEWNQQLHTKTEQNVLKSVSRIKTEDLVFLVFFFSLCCLYSRWLQTFLGNLQSFFAAQLLTSLSGDKGVTSQLCPLYFALSKL